MALMMQSSKLLMQMLMVIPQKLFKKFLECKNNQTLFQLYKIFNLET